MSRGTDLTHVENQLKALDREATQAVQTYQTYHAEVTEAVKDRLTAAGIWDEIHGMELEREAVRQKVDEKVNGLRAEYQKLVTVREFLIQRDKDEKGTPQDPTEDPIEEPDVEAAQDEAPVAETTPQEEPEASQSSETDVDQSPNGVAEVIQMTGTGKAVRPRPAAPKI